MSENELSVYAKNKLNKNAPNNTWVKLFELIPRGARVLDVGCSTGNFGHRLIKDKDCQVTGIDIFKEDLKIAKTNLTEAQLLNIEQDSIEHLGKFDVVIMADVIEHLIDPVSSLIKIRKVLRPGGIFVFSVPNMANFATRVELLKGRFEYTSFGLLDQTHLHYYDRIQLETVLHNAGFSVQKYNNTIRDIPRQTLEKEIKNIGLEGNKKFWHLAEHPDSVTFQFIGVAVPSKKSHAPIASRTPYDFIDRQLQDTTDKFNQIIQSLEEKLNTEKSRRKQVENSLNMILSSKGWRALSKVYKVEDKIMRRFRSGRS